MLRGVIGMNRKAWMEWETKRRDGKEGDRRDVKEWEEERVAGTKEEEWEWTRRHGKG